MDITESVLYKFFFVFGEIEKIDLRPDKGYAFLRFYTVKAATHAADWANTTAAFHEPLKVSFSDHLRRKNILGDKQGYELTAHNCHTLVVIYGKHAGPLPSTETIGQIFSQYGLIKGLYVRETPGHLTREFTFIRSSVLVDFDTPQQAQEARSDLFENDAFGTKRRELGDKECKIEFALPRAMAEVVAPEKSAEALDRFSQRDVTRSTLLSLHQETNSLILSIVNNNPEAPRIYEDPGMLAAHMREVFSAKFKGQQFASQPPVFPGFAPMGVGAPPFLGPRPAPAVQYDPALSPYVRPPMAAAGSSPFNRAPAPSSAPNLNKLLQSLLGGKKGGPGDKDDPPQGGGGATEQQQSDKPSAAVVAEGEVLANDNNLVWSGFLTRMSKSRQRVGVDAFQVFGDASKYLTEYNLNITLRTQCDEALKRYPLAVAAFVPQNETQESLFKQYMDYFASKDRAGVIELKKSGHLIYLLPQNEIANRFFPEEKGADGRVPEYLVAVFTEATPANVETHLVEEKLREIHASRRKEKKDGAAGAGAKKVDLVGLFGDPTKFMKRG